MRFLRKIKTLKQKLYIQRLKLQEIRAELNNVINRFNEILSSCATFS